MSNLNIYVDELKSNTENDLNNKNGKSGYGPSRGSTSKCNENRYSPYNRKSMRLRNDVYFSLAEDK